MIVNDKHVGDVYLKDKDHRLLNHAVCSMIEKVKTMAVNLKNVVIDSKLTDYEMFYWLYVIKCCYYACRCLQSLFWNWGLYLLNYQSHCILFIV